MEQFLRGEELKSWHRIEDQVVRRRRPYSSFSSFIDRISPVVRGVSPNLNGVVIVRWNGRKAL